MQKALSMRYSHHRSLPAGDFINVLYRLTCFEPELWEKSIDTTPKNNYSIIRNGYSYPEQAEGLAL